MNDPLTEAAAALCRQYPGMTAERAYQLALQDNPTAYHHATPEGSEGHPGDRDDLVPPGPTAVPYGVPRRHYSQLSAVEKAALPLRRLASGEAMRADRAYIAKLSGTEVGGGTFEVVA